MIKFFTVFLVLSLATTVHSQGDSGNRNAVRPVLYEYLERSSFGVLMSLACTVKDTLSDREVSDRIYKISDGLLQDVIEKGLACAKPILFGAMNDHNSAVGKAFTIIRMGNQGEITDWSDIISAIPREPMFLVIWLYTGLQTMVKQIGDTPGVERQMTSLRKQIGEQCHTQEFDELRANVLFVLNRLGEKGLANLP